MGKYMILKMEANVHDRFAEIQDLENGNILNVVFSEYTDDVVPERTPGKTIEHELYLWDTESRGVSTGQLAHKQPLLHGAHTEAVVEITKVLNDQVMTAKSSISADDIIIEFWYPQTYSVGDRVIVDGTLSLGQMIP